MSVGISMKELLGWSEEASAFWKQHLDANPDLLKLPCGIGGASTVNDLVRHVWGADLRWAQRLAGVPVIAPEDVPAGPLEAIYAVYTEALRTYRSLLDNPDENWEAPYMLDIPRLSPEKIAMSRRKVLAHALMHGHRHWAQLATLLRVEGHPSGFRGDVLFSAALS